MRYNDRDVIISLLEAAMYLDFTVKIPDAGKGITRKKVKGTTYIYYTFERSYDPEKKYTVPQSTSIGKCSEDNPEMMYPNSNYIKFFPDAELPEEKNESNRSSCLRIGTFLILRRIIAEYHLDEILSRLIGADSGLFLDLAAYTIIAENNAGQYYPDYAYNHPLFTNKMKVYSDTKISSFINSVTRDQSLAFLDEWNELRDHRERIYISYDSTNKNSQAGDLDLVEIGHPKEDVGAPIFNYSIAFDRNNSLPLFYEAYPGSIVDVSQLQLMLEKANGYGYKHIGFILDRGYFCKENIRFMDKCGYEFIIMMKGMKSLVKDLILQVKGSFEEYREYSIRDYRVNGITVKRKLYPSDERERYFHIYYSDRRKAAERENIELRVDQMAQFLQEHEGRALSLEKPFQKYFDLTFFHKGQSDEKFLHGTERHAVIDEDIRLCGYFVIITSEKMTAEAAINLYKSRDASEKLFRGDKSYLGNKSLRVQSNESLHSKIFIEFIALIIRNRFHLYLNDYTLKTGKKQNYMTVPAAIRELEKIEIIRQADRNYRLDHAITAKQKEILKAFGMTASTIREQAVKLNDSLQAIINERV